MSLSIQLFRAISPGTPAKILDVVLPLINRMMIEHHISERKQRVAVLFAQLIVECESFTRLEENLNYKPEVLLSQWATHFTREQAQKYGRTARHSADVHMIANLAYGGRNGNHEALPYPQAAYSDGWRYRGSGWAMTTGRYNFGEVQKVTGKPVLEHPELLRTHEISALATGAFWANHGIEAFADRGDIVGASRIWNGGDIGLPQRREIYDHVLSVLG